MRRETRTKRNTARKKARRKNPLTDAQRARKYWDNNLRRYKRRVVNKGHSEYRIRDIELSDYSRACAWIEVLSFDPCCFCGKLAQDIDHIDSLHLTGMDGNKWDNLTAACSDCNNRKRERKLLFFMLGGD